MGLDLYLTACTGSRQADRRLLPPPESGHTLGTGDVLG